MLSSTCLRKTCGTQSSRNHKNLTKFSSNCGLLDKSSRTCKWSVNVLIVETVAPTEHIHNRVLTIVCSQSRTWNRLGRSFCSVVVMTDCCPVRIGPLYVFSDGMEWSTSVSRLSWGVEDSMSFMTACVGNPGLSEIMINSFCSILKYLFEYSEFQIK